MSEKVMKKTYSYTFEVGDIYRKNDSSNRMKIIGFMGEKWIELRECKEDGELTGHGGMYHYTPEYILSRWTKIKTAVQN